MNKTIIASGALAIALVGGGAAGYALHGTSSSSAKHTTNSISGASLGSVAGRASATAHNVHDVSFAQDMIEHHQQAIEMAGMAATHTTNTKVLVLATTIDSAQSPEIQKMTGWQTAWGTPTTPSTSSSGTGGMPSGSMNMNGGSRVSGMMSTADMTSLAGLSGEAFDKMFLSMMTQHHDGAITMAQQELASGQYGDSLALAASIVVSQQAQIQQMHQLLSA